MAIPACRRREDAPAAPSSPCSARRKDPCAAAPGSPGVVGSRRPPPTSSASRPPRLHPSRYPRPSPPPATQNPVRFECAGRLPALPVVVEYAARPPPPTSSSVLPKPCSSSPSGPSSLLRAFPTFPGIHRSNQRSPYELVPLRHRSSSIEQVAIDSAPIALSAGRSTPPPSSCHTTLSSASLVREKAPVEGKEKITRV